MFNTKTEPVAAIQLYFHLRLRIYCENEVALPELQCSEFKASYS